MDVQPESLALPDLQEQQASIVRPTDASVNGLGRAGRPRPTAASRSSAGGSCPHPVATATATACTSRPAAVM
jgi:hypothetical protein